LQFTSLSLTIPITNLPPGIARKQPRSNAQFSPEIKEFLIILYTEGEKSNSKFIPEQAFTKMLEEFGEDESLSKSPPFLRAKNLVWYC